MRDPSPADPLDAALYDADPVARDGARTRLAARADAAAIAALVGLLDAPRRTTRRRAARILSDIHPARARPALLAALDDPEAPTRRRVAAARVLAVMAEAVEPALTRRLRDDADPRVRRACATPATEPAALLAALGDPDAGVVERAAWALETIDLEGGAVDPSAAADALRRAAPGASAVVRRLLARVDPADPALAAAARAGDATALDHLTDPPTLTALLDGPRVAAAWGLARVGDPALAALAADPDPRVRAAAARGLPADHPALAALAGDRDPGVAWLARRNTAARFTPDALRRRLAPHARSDAPSARPPYGLRPGDLIPPARRAPAALAMCHPRFDINLGVAVRSAEAVGLREVFLVGRGELFQSPARGTDRLLPLRHAPDPAALLRMAREADYQIVAVQQTPDSVPFHRAEYPPRPLFVVGAEDVGVPPPLRAAADLIVELPMWGAIDSLNVAAATTAVLFHWRAHAERAPAC